MLLLLKILPRKNDFFLEFPEQLSLEELLKTAVTVIKTFVSYFLIRYAQSKITFFNFFILIGRIKTFFLCWCSHLKFLHNFITSSETKSATHNRYLLLLKKNFCLAVHYLKRNQWIFSIFWYIKSIVLKIWQSLEYVRFRCPCPSYVFVSSIFIVKLY